jgi:D-alanine-D-alanine ligase-like ATP-grasp enzyme
MRSSAAHREPSPLAPAGPPSKHPILNHPLRAGVAWLAGSPDVSMVRDSILAGSWRVSARRKGRFRPCDRKVDVVSNVRRLMMWTRTSRRPTLFTACLGRLSQMGKPGQVLSLEADVLRAAGPTALRQAWLEGARAHSWGPQVRRNVYRRIWEDAATELGAELVPLGGEFLSYRRGTAQTTVWYHQVMLDNAVHLQLALNKGIVQRLLAEAGLPVAPSTEFDASDAGVGLAFMAEVGGSCVVKPADGTSGGQGVTCGVDTAERFHRARVWAQRWDERLIIEQQARGEEYRFLLLDGQLLGIVRRRPPRLVGNGHTSVIELIAAENRRRVASDGEAGMSPMLVELDCILALQRSGLRLGSVPPEGKVFEAKAMVNSSGAADTDTLSREDVAPELVSEATTAATAVGVRLASVEVITPDPTRSLEESGGVILEVNGTPGLHYHYLVSTSRGPDRVAVPILATLLDMGTSPEWEHKETGAGAAGI